MSQAWGMPWFPDCTQGPLLDLGVTAYPLASIRAGVGRDHIVPQGTAHLEGP